jgi:hypothetical protein
MAKSPDDEYMEELEAEISSLKAQLAECKKVIETMLKNEPELEAKPIGAFPWFTVIHKKTGNEYTVTGEILNCTNAQSGQTMIIYQRNSVSFVRAWREFLRKFDTKPAQKEEA